MSDPMSGISEHCKIIYYLNAGLFKRNMYILASMPYMMATITTITYIFMLTTTKKWDNYIFYTCMDFDGVTCSNV